MSRGDKIPRGKGIGLSDDEKTFLIRGPHTKSNEEWGIRQISRGKIIHSIFGETKRISWHNTSYTVG
jgi:hypothetical protein